MSRTDMRNLIVEKAILSRSGTPGAYGLGELHRFGGAVIDSRRYYITGYAEKHKLLVHKEKTTPDEPEWVPVVRAYTPQPGNGAGLYLAMKNYVIPRLVLLWQHGQRLPWMGEFFSEYGPEGRSAASGQGNINGIYFDPDSMMTHDGTQVAAMCRYLDERLSQVGLVIST